MIKGAVSKMQKKVFQLLVDNNPGVLSRISGLFSRRGYNIDSLTVSPTNDPGLSRIVIAFVIMSLISAFIGLISTYSFKLVNPEDISSINGLLDESAILDKDL